MCLGEEGGGVGGVACLVGLWMQRAALLYQSCGCDGNDALRGGGWVGVKGLASHSCDARNTAKAYVDLWSSRSWVKPEVT